MKLYFSETEAAGALENGSGACLHHGLDHLARYVAGEGGLHHFPVPKRIRHAVDRAGHGSELHRVFAFALHFHPHVEISHEPGAVR